MKNKDTYIKINRQYFESPFWVLKKGKQRTKAEAYIDLFNMATVKNNRYTTPDYKTTITTTRGEGVWSLRYLARRWHWSKGKTETFLKILKTRKKARQYLRQGIMVTFLMDYSISQDKIVPVEKAKKDGVEDGVRTGSGRGKDKYKNVKNVKNVKNDNKTTTIPAEPSGMSVKPYILKTDLVSKVIYDFKARMGVSVDDRDWDKLNWARYAKSAKKLVSYIKTEESIFKCIEELIFYFEENNLSWTIETILKWADKWKSGKYKKEEEEDEPPIHYET